MDITEKYACLILEVLFRSTLLLAKIGSSDKNSEERKRYELELEAIKEFFSEYVSEYHDDLVQAFRKDKAAQMLLGIKSNKEEE